MLAAVAATREDMVSRATIEAIVAGTGIADTPLLKELAALKEAGIITADEFAAKKTELLARL